MTLDPEVRDLLAAVQDALAGLPDPWRIAAGASAIGRVLDGQDDPGVAADWLRDFLRTREQATAEPPLPRRQATHPTARTSDVRTEHV